MIKIFLNKHYRRLKSTAVRISALISVFVLQGFVSKMALAQGDSDWVREGVTVSENASAGTLELILPWVGVGLILLALFALWKSEIRKDAIIALGVAGFLMGPAFSMWKLLFGL